MPTFDVEKEEITAFQCQDTILFKEYFDQDALFKKLEKYYNSSKYRFEVPDKEIEEVQQTLDNFYYELQIVDNITDYCVVVNESGDSTEILRNSVMKTKRSNQDVFVMKDELSVRQAEEKGATRLEKSTVNSGDLPWVIDGS